MERHRAIQSAIHHNRWIFFFIALSICSCRTSEEKNRPEQDSSSDSSEQIFPASAYSSVLDSLEYELFHAYNSSQQALIQRYGSPQKIQFEPVQNAFTNGVDTIITLDYRQRKISLYHMNIDGRYLLTGIALTDSALFLETGFLKGTLRDSIESFIQKPHSINRGSQENEIILEYPMGKNAGGSFFLFIFINNQLQRIEYIPYID